MIKFQMSTEYEEYYNRIQKDVDRLYEVAVRARKKGLDPSLEPEPQMTFDIADRIEKLIGPVGIGDRIRELEGMDRQDMAFKIAEEIVLGRFGKFEREQAADQAIRTALALMTEGVTIAPIQGIPNIRVKRNPDRSQYLAVYFAGPIRPAGGTAQALTLVVADFVRQRLGLERYQSTGESIGRFIEEVRLYELKVRRFQYHVSDEDLEYALRRLPVEATGVSTDPYEVSNFKNVPGVETNRLRGGALIVVVDGIVGRAGKLCGICEKLHIGGWEWLKKIGEKLIETGFEQSKPAASFMEEIIVGRPVFSFPNTNGGFRLRYGRARNTGLAAVGVHPATMQILNRFLTTGVQLRIELPGKSATVTPVDSIEPPVVKLKDGSVIRIETEDDANKFFEEVDEILALGDILINAGDFIQNNKNLLKSGYDENQWCEDLKKRLLETEINKASEKSGLLPERLLLFEGDPSIIPTPQEAIEMTKFDVPLHPKYTYLWPKISSLKLLKLRKNLIESWPKSEPYEFESNLVDKKTLEELLVPHRVENNKIIFEEAAPVLEKCLALEKPEFNLKSVSSIDIIRELSGLDIKEKAPVHIGARMGRPEKARERKMSPYVHGLFPISNSGGPQRDITKVKKGQLVQIEIVNKHCTKCGQLTFGVKCSKCGGDVSTKRSCKRCGLEIESETCPSCNIDTVEYHTEKIELRKILEEALNVIGGPLPRRIKCVKRLMNTNRTPEPLEKGLLRARYDLSVFKDGTLRYDITDVPLTHFKPNEVEIPIEKLKELGYTHDKNGVLLVSSDQILELKVQDVILPEECGKYFVKVSKFIDDLLTKFYNLEPYYNITEPNDIIGLLIHGLAPHTSATIIGRVVGYTKGRVCYGHPLWHAAKRRNCDGDEDAVMLGLDPLLNFSRAFLPEQSGGLMDAPLYVIPLLNPGEVDKEAHNIDVMSRYPPEFYRLCWEEASPGEYMKLINTIARRLGTEAQFQGFEYTEDCSNLNLGTHLGAYNTLKTMLDKLESQLELSEKIKAVEASAVAKRVLTSHFMKDIVGNLRAFTSQRFRCVKCNRKYRRLPLKGVCVRCGGKLTLTVHKGGIEKYLDPALKLVERYNLDDYYADRLELVKLEISSLFPKTEPEEENDQKQISLTDFMKSKKDL